jgi:hypothetical protein
MSTPSVDPAPEGTVVSKQNVFGAHPVREPVNLSPTMFLNEYSPQTGACGSEYWN